MIRASSDNLYTLEETKSKTLLRSLSMEDINDVTITALMEDILPANVVQNLCYDIITKKITPSTDNGRIIWNNKGAVELYFCEISGEFGVWLLDNKYKQFQFMIDPNTGYITLCQAAFMLEYFGDEKVCRSQRLTVQDGKWIET